jgi:hypothetical protein
MGLDIYFEKVKRTEVGYFRKINFLVKYFETLGFNGGNLEPFNIKKEYIITLKDKCKYILKANELFDDIKEEAEKVLPNTSGFCFGSTDYDEYYLKDIQEVYDYCNDTLIPLFDTLGPNETIQFKIWY